MSFWAYVRVSPEQESALDTGGEIEFRSPGALALVIEGVGIVASTLVEDFDDTERSAQRFGYWRRRFPSGRMRQRNARSRSLIDRYGEAMPHDSSRQRFRPVQRPPELARFEAMWVAVLNGAVVAAEHTSHKFATRLHSMDHRKREVTVEYVRPQSDRYIVGGGSPWPVASIPSSGARRRASSAVGEPEQDGEAEPADGDVRCPGAGRQVVYGHEWPAQPASRTGPEIHRGIPISVR